VDVDQLIFGQSRKAFQNLPLQEGDRSCCQLLAPVETRLGGMV
jgi:hypothetical protein